MIGRRAFVGVVGLLATAAGRAAWSQQPGRLPRLALVDPGLSVESIAEGGQANWDALFRGLRAQGLVEGETIGIERWTAAGAMDLDGLAQQIVATEPDLLVGFGRFLIEALGQATSTIPIVGLGTFRDINYARPGGNVTGIDVTGGTAILVKQLELLSVSAPAAARVGYLATRESWEGPIGAAVREAASQLGLTVPAVTVAPPVGEATIRAAFAGIEGGAPEALYIGPLGAFTPYFALIASLALEHRLPATSGFSELPAAGLLMSYGPDLPETFRRAAHYVDRILAGAQPGGMAIELPSAFEFVVNLRTAESLGLTLPPEIMLLATEFIE
jgi:putative ABC transport system substrate-binding protein